jgi:hypothetical protein
VAAPPGIRQSLETARHTTRFPAPARASYTSSADAQGRPRPSRHNTVPLNTLSSRASLPVLYSRYMVQTRHLRTCANRPIDGLSHILSTRHLHAALWTTSTSSRMGRIDCMLPIGCLHKLIGDGHHHARLSLEMCPRLFPGNNKALSGRRQVQTTGSSTHAELLLRAWRKANDRQASLGC